MATTVFVSPGVYTREQDFTFFASRIGITKLGLVGVTLKGPAFEPTKISTTEEFFTRFGTTDTSMQTPYVANTFLKQSGELVMTRILGLSGYSSSTAWIVSASADTTTHSATTLCIIRSKLNTATNTFYNTATGNLNMSGYTLNQPLSSFTLYSTSGTLSAFTTGSIQVSLDETRDDYIVKILGTNPKKITGDYGLYVDQIFPHFLREAVSRGEIANLKTSLTTASTQDYTNFNTGFTNSVTPWIVSKVVGSSVRDLFRFQTIPDGNASASEIKISISNIDTLAKSFDVFVRYFSDTDSSSMLAGLERFRACSLDSSSENFIGRLIGTTDENYPRKSNYITLDLADNFPSDTLPAGFKGYYLRKSTAVGTTLNAPNIYYKTTYLSGDNVSKTYLGVSELGYTAFTQSQTSFGNVIKSVETDLFKFQGVQNQTSGITQIRGFHMESGADSTAYVTGIYPSITGYTRSQRKFTVAPAGGFDGWSPYRDPDFTDAAADVNYLNALKRAVDSMAPAETYDYNVFAMPVANYSDHFGAVNYALTMIETRADALYIIDSPRITTGTTKGTPDTAVSLLQATGIDSNYAATYWPWLQINDANTNKYTFISPTSEVVKAIALTDNVSFPWFAPAGINRGTVSSNVVTADIKLTTGDRDTLYDARINPIATFVQNGITIWGQKTLQLKPSALDRINIRRLVLQVRRLVAAASYSLIFEPNDQTLKDQFLAKVEPILLQIQNQRGLAAFRVTMEDQVNAADVFDRNTLRGKVQLKPTYAMEFLDLTFQILPNGANFSDF